MKTPSCYKNLKTCESCANFYVCKYRALRSSIAAKTASKRGNTETGYYTEQNVLLNDY